MISLFRSSAMRDATVSLLGILALALLGNQFDLFELLYDLSRAREAWEVDEVVLVLFVSPLLLVWFALRRWREARREFQLRRERERELAQAQKLEALGRLAGGIAHEVNNLLSPVMMGIGMLRLDASVSESSQNYLDAMLEGTSRCKNLVAQILNYSRGLVVETVKLNFKESLQTALELVRPNLPKGIKIDTDVSDDVGYIEFSMQGVISVVLNLLTNAADAMGGTGTVAMRLCEVHLDEAKMVTTGKLSAGSFIYLQVTDSGSGIPEKVVGQVFDPFFTTKPIGQGTSLGLSLVYSLVTRARGEIEIESSEAGTAFHVYFPKVAAPQ